LIEESVRCDLSKCYGVVTGTSALYFGGQAHDSWPRNLALGQIFLMDFSRRSKYVLV